MRRIITSTENGLALHIDLAAMPRHQLARVQRLATSAAGDGTYPWQQFYAQLNYTLATALALRDLHAAELISDWSDDADAAGEIVSISEE